LVFDKHVRLVETALFDLVVPNDLKLIEKHPYRVNQVSAVLVAQGDFYALPRLFVPCGAEELVVKESYFLVQVVRHLLECLELVLQYLDVVAFNLVKNKAENFDCQMQLLFVDEVANVPLL